MSELHPIKARKDHTCDWCGNSVPKGTTYYGYHQISTYHTTGPGSHKGHDAWEFENICLCPSCYKKRDASGLKCETCGREIGLLEAVHTEKKDVYYASGKLLKLGHYIRKYGNPDHIRHQDCPGGTT